MGPHLTKIDCQFYRRSDASLETCSYVALNPRAKPGSLVVVGASAARGNIGGQVACRLALEHFVDGVFQYCAETAPLNGASTHESNGDLSDPSVAMLETGFKNANSSVYNFGHKLAAGGRMAASLLALVIESDSVAAGKVGDGSAYLFRDGTLFPFFDNSIMTEEPAHGFVGSNSLVSVELASVPASAQDIILFFSSNLTKDKSGQLKAALTELSQETYLNCQQISARLLTIAEPSVFFMTARIGPEAVYLRNALEVGF